MTSLIEEEEIAVPLDIGEGTLRPVDAMLIPKRGDEAVTALHPHAQAVLAEMLQADEKVEHVEQTVFWQRAVLIVSALGTVAFLVVVIFFNKVIDVSSLVMMLVFPILLLVSIYGYYRNKRSFVAFTNRRVLVKPGFGARWAVEYKYLREVKQETNYLHCRQELQLRRFIQSEGRPKVTYVEGIPYIDFYLNFLEDIVAKNLKQEQAAPGQ